MANDSYYLANNHTVYLEITNEASLLLVNDKRFNMLAKRLTEYVEIKGRLCFLWKNVPRGIAYGIVDSVCHLDKNSLRVAMTGPNCGALLYDWGDLKDNNVSFEFSINKSGDLNNA